MKVNPKTAKEPDPSNTEFVSDQMVEDFQYHDLEHILDSVPLGDISHFGRPLKSHLQGTCGLLMKWGSPRPVLLAGLLHSVYGTRTFPHAALDQTSRSRLQAMIGSEAENLVYLFAMSDRKRLLMENPRPPFAWVDHRTGQRRELSAEALRALAEIEAANFLEQLHLVNSPHILLDMQERFEAAAHLLSESGMRALRTRLTAALFSNSGYGLARGLMGKPEIEPLVREAMALWSRFCDRGAANLRVGIRIDQSGAPILERLDPVSDISPVFQSLNDHPALLTVAESGLGERVTVMKEKLIFKWPGTPGFGAHRDSAYNTPRTGVPGSEALTVCLALAAANSANGALELFPSLRSSLLAAPSGEARDIDEAQLAGIESSMPELDPGDAVLFDGEVPHRSGWNHSDGPRLTYMVTYVPARFSNAREDYYAERRREQGQERRLLLSEPLYFE